VLTEKKTFPKRELTFAAFHSLSPKEINVVIVGQDPYPRENSAIGVAFNDGEILKWGDPFSPSFRNIIKNMLIGEDLLEKSSKVEELRKVCRTSKLLDPPDWFNSTILQGVCWLNTSLTFTSTDKEDLTRHVAFWKPCIEAILRILLNAKKELVKSKQNEKASIVFVLWGGYAKKLKPVINKINGASDPALEIAFVEGNHPAVETFHNIDSFALVNEHLESMGAPKINWLPKKSGDASDGAEDEQPTTNKNKRSKGGKGGTKKKKK